MSIRAGNELKSPTIEIQANKATCTVTMNFKNLGTQGFNNNFDNRSVVVKVVSRTR